MTPRPGIDKSKAEIFGTTAEKRGRSEAKRVEFMVKKRRG
jgi:hypothetical protein